MYVGIDVSKDKSNICILDKERVVEQFEIQHNREGFKQLERHLTQDMKIGMETTSCYCQALYSFLKKNYDVCYVDNVQMKNFAKLHSLHLKNDKIDAKMIAKYLSYDLKKINTEHRSELQDLSRMYLKTVKKVTTYKYSFANQLSIIFPELSRHFYTKKTLAIASLLLIYPTPKEIANATEKELCEALNKLHKSNVYTRKFAAKLKEIAKDSIGVENYPTECFKYTIQMMLFFRQLVLDMKKVLKKELMKTPYFPLLDKYGYNVAGLSVIVGEVGDIRRFATHRKFVGYCGFDISQNQSGKSNSRATYITKQGNRYLRSTFYNQVLCHLRYKKEISKFFYKLKEKGKHPKQAMVAAARKVAIRCYYDMMACH